MTDLNDESGNRHRAAALLAVLMEEAREVIGLKILLGRPPSPHPGLAWIAPGMVTGVHAYEDASGWRCELLLDTPPAGRPDRVCAPAPLPDRDAAMSFALLILCEALHAPPQAPESPAPLPLPTPPAPAPELPVALAFEYDGIPVPLSPRTVRGLREAGMDHITERYVRRRLDEIRRDVARGERITLPAIEGLGPDARRTFLTVCTMAALKGIVRWPDAGA